jgi:hypothetical protein
MTAEKAKRATVHQYPSNYSPDSHNPFIRRSWELMDKLTPGAMADEARFFLAGLIAGALTQAYDFGKEKRDPKDLGSHDRQG